MTRANGGPVNGPSRRLVGEEGCAYVIPPRRTCGRQVPYSSHGRGYYYTCDLPHGHDGPCSGRATDWGAPTP